MTFLLTSLCRVTYAVISHFAHLFQFRVIVNSLRYSQRFAKVYYGVLLNKKCLEKAVNCKIQCRFALPKLSSYESSYCLFGVFNGV